MRHLAAISRTSAVRPLACLLSLSALLPACGGGPAGDPDLGSPNDSGPGDQGSPSDSDVDDQGSAGVGILDGSPGLVVLGDDVATARLRVFAGDSNGNLYSRSETDTGWTEWTTATSMTNITDMRLDAVSWGGERVDLTARGMCEGQSNAVCQAFFAGTWSSFFDLRDMEPGDVSNGNVAPTIGSGAPEHLLVTSPFSTQDDPLEIRMRYWNGGAWLPWATAGGLSSVRYHADVAGFADETCPQGGGACWTWESYLVASTDHATMRIVVSRVYANGGTVRGESVDLLPSVGTGSMYGAVVTTRLVGNSHVVVVYARAELAGPAAWYYRIIGVIDPIEVDPSDAGAFDFDATHVTWDAVWTPVAAPPFVSSSLMNCATSRIRRDLEACAIRDEDRRIWLGTREGTATSLSWTPLGSP